MRRFLATLLSVATVGLTAATALAQTDAYGRPTNPYQQYDNRYSQPQYDDRSYGRPYVQPYGQPPQYRGDPYRGQRAQYGGLRILEAWYGQRRRVCDASHTLRSACEGRQSCDFKVGNELCGDPLPGVVKGIRLTYDCHGRVQHVDEMETRHLSLRC